MRCLDLAVDVLLFRLACEFVRVNDQGGPEGHWIHLAGRGS